MSHHLEAGCALATLVGLLIMLGVGIRDYRREKRRTRSDQHLIDHIRMSHGMRELQRQGRLPDDVQ